MASMKSPPNYQNRWLQAEREARRSDGKSARVPAVKLLTFVNAGRLVLRDQGHAAGYRWPADDQSDGIVCCARGQGESSRDTARLQARPLSGICALAHIPGPH